MVRSCHFRDRPHDLVSFGIFPGSALSTAAATYPISGISDDDLLLQALEYGMLILKLAITMHV